MCRSIRRPVQALVLLCCAATLGVAGSADATALPEGDRYLVIFEHKAIDTDRATGLLEGYGAEIYRPLWDLGMAIVTVDDPSLAAALADAPGIEGVRPDEVRDDLYAQPTEPLLAAEVRSVSAATRSQSDAGGFTFVHWTERPERGPEVPASALTQTPFWPFTWNWSRTEAPGAWALGHAGHRNVEVAIVGSGLDYTHPELLGRVDLDRSVNFIPEDAALVEELFPGAHPIAELGLHSSYVASIITCTAFGQPCYAPNATLVGIKVQDKDEDGTLGDLVTGIHYGGEIRADIIVLPDLYGLFDLRVTEDRLDVLAVLRAVTYAKLRGSLVLGASWGSDRGEVGNNADLDPLVVQLPSQAGTVVVQATGPEDQWSNFTDYGFTLIDVAAPGGYVDPETVEPPPGVNVITVGICSSFTQFTRIRDFPSECNKDTGPQYIFSFGSRSAVADAAGVAALIDSRWHGFLPGVLVRTKLLNTADDILEPGIDAFSGHGRVNARRGVTE